MPASRTKIRIGHLLTALWPGGLERFVLTLADSLPADEFELCIYSWMGDDPWLEEFRKLGIPVRQLNAPNRITGPKSLLQILRAWCELVAMLRDDRIEILQTHDFFPSLIGRTASLLAGVSRRVSTLHNLYSWWPEWVFACNRLLAHRTDAIVCVSESVRRYFIAREGLPPDRYRTILNSVDGQHFVPDATRREPIRRELGIAPDEILIGSVGSITTRKAQHLLVEAASTLIAEGHRIQVRFWGANRANPQHAEQEVQARITALGLQSQVQILPPRQDIEAVFAALDIHCMTSVAEGLSLASIEAVLAGAIAVYSDIGPFQEVVEDGATGFLFKSGDSQDLARVLRRVMTDPTGLVDLREKARGAAMQRFGMDRFASEWSTLYRSIR